MAELTLKPREIDTLKLNIGDDSFQIPLATSMTYEEALGMDTMEGAIAFFRKYIRADVADMLTLMNYRDIINAWKDASEEAGGKTPGES